MGEWYEIYVKGDFYINEGDKRGVEYQKGKILKTFKVKKSDIKVKKVVNPNVTYAGHMPFYYGAGTFTPEADEKFASKHPNLVRKGIKFRHYKKFLKDGSIELW